MSGDVHILKGMDAIINFDNVKPGIDLKELENKFINGGIVSQKVKDPQDRLNDELRVAAQRLGITFDDVSVGKKNVMKPVHNSPVHSQTRNSPVHSQTCNSPLKHTPAHEQWNDDDNEDNNEDNDNVHDQDDADVQDRDNEDDHGDYQPEPVQSSPFARAGFSSSITNSGAMHAKNNGSLYTHTLEQERRSHIDSIVRPDPNLSFSLEKEKREDMKCAMMAEIDSLLSSLKMEEVDLDRIPPVNMKSSFEEIETVLKILRHKNDQTRCCTFAEEIMMFGAYALEDIFDGKRMYFGRWSPDLTGWHNHLNVKLKRCKYDTGQVVGGIMEDFNIGAGTRVAIEIIPNMFLYSKMRKQQHSQPSIAISDEEVENASQRIRNL